jgi:hypothetical protein
MVLMAGAASHTRDSLSVNAAPDVHCVSVQVVSLPGKVSTGMAIHATRMPENWEYRLKGRYCFCIVATSFRTGLFNIRVFRTPSDGWECPMNDQATRRNRDDRRRKSLLHGH